MTARVLLAYASTKGSTRQTCEELAQRLGEHGLQADVRDARTVTDVSGYHAVVLGSYLWLGRWHRDARGFAQRFARALTDTPVWLFSCRPPHRSADKPEVPPVPSAARAASILHARGHATFDSRAEPPAPGASGPALGLDHHGQPEQLRAMDPVRTYADTIAAGLGRPALARTHPRSRIRPSCATEATSRPPWVKSRPVVKPLPPEADGDAWS